MNKFMRMIVLFDLPVVTAREKKIASKFRNFLLKDGYHMVQYSVYSRICNGVTAIEKHEARLKQNLPSKGSVRLLTITEKQYESMQILLGKTTFADSCEASELLSVF